MNDTNFETSKFKTTPDECAIPEQYSAAPGNTLKSQATPPQSTPNPTPPFNPNVNQTNDDGKGFATASLVCGILSFFCLGFVGAILGIVLGTLAKTKGYKGSMATAGIVCGFIGIILIIIGTIVGLIAGFSVDPYTYY